LFTITPDVFIAGICARMQRNTEVRNPSMVRRQASSLILPTGAPLPPLPPLLNA
jgi:hypothetical protein